MDGVSQTHKLHDSHIECPISFRYDSFNNGLLERASMYIKAVFHDNILYELCPLIALKIDGHFSRVVVEKITSSRLPICHS